MKENENKALELNEEELAQVSGGLELPGLVTGGGETANDGICGQTVDLDSLGICTTYINFPCNGCKYKPGNTES